MSNLTKNLNRLRMEKKLCDITLKIGEEKFHCHRIILASISEYFETMFTSDFIEHNLNEIPLVDFDQISFQVFLDWAYTENTTAITPNNVMDVLKMARRLLSESLVEYLENYMKENLSISNLVDYYNFSVDFQFPKVTKFCAKYLETNFWYILENKIYLKLSFEVFKNCVASNEKSKLGMITNWIEYDKIKRSNYLEDLTKCVALKEPQICIAAIYRDYKYPGDKPTVLFSYDSFNGLNKCRDDVFNSFNNWFLDFLEHYYGYPIGKSDMSIVALNQEIFVLYIGGEETNSKFFRRLNPYSESWIELKNADTPFDYNGEGPVASIVSINRMNKIFVSGCLSPRLHFYNADLDRWGTVSNRMCRNINSRSLVACHNALYLCGGSTWTFQSVISLYDHRVPKIQDVGFLKVPTEESAACILRNRIYVTGGRDVHYGDTSIVQRYDITAGKTEIVEPMIQKRCRHSVVSYDDKIWATGLYGGAVEFYDEKKNKWQITDWNIDSEAIKIFMC